MRIFYSCCLLPSVATRPFRDLLRIHVVFDPGVLIWPGLAAFSRLKTHFHQWRAEYQPAC